MMRSERLRALGIAGVLAIAAMGTLAGCPLDKAVVPSATSQSGPPTTAGTDPNAPRLPEGVAPIAFATKTVTIGGKPIVVEIADNDEKRERGLMYRWGMPTDRGMIFVFEEVGRYGFWMKNTEIPLDIIFLNDGGKVVEMFTMQPHDERATPTKEWARYAIELNMGSIDRLGIKVGTQVGGVGGK